MSAYNIITTNGELFHHGIKGQKWGVRRFQNPDGTLTEAGIQKYRKHYDHAKNLQNFRDIQDRQSQIKVLADYNKKYYEEKFKTQYNLLNKKIGEVGINQIEDSIKAEGRKAGLKAMDEANRINKSVDKTNADLINKYGKTHDLTNVIRSNEAFKVDPQKYYDDAYNRYTKKNLIVK